MQDAATFRATPTTPAPSRSKPFFKRVALDRLRSSLGSSPGHHRSPSQKFDLACPFEQRLSKNKSSCWHPILPYYQSPTPHQPNLWCRTSRTRKTPTHPQVFVQITMPRSAPCPSLLPANFDAAPPTPTHPSRSAASPGVGIFPSVPESEGPSHKSSRCFRSPRKASG